MCRVRLSLCLFRENLVECRNVQRGYDEEAEVTRTVQDAEDERAPALDLVKKLKLAILARGPVC